MNKNLNRLLLAFSVLLLLSLALFLFHNIVLVSDMVAALHPGIGLALKYALFSLVLLGLLWLVGAFLIRPGALVPPVDPTPEEKSRYLARLDARLRKSRLLRQSGCDESCGLEDRLRVLDGLADEEIGTTAKKVFLSTAVAQNGHLDSLIVFVSMARLVWRVSHIYNQRPSLGEMGAIYRNVAGSCFVTYGVDEIDIKSQINALVEPLMAHAVGHLPVVSSVTSAFANAFFHGAVNCILVSRVGLMTKNYLSVGYDLECGLRRSSFRDAVAFARQVFSGSFKELRGALREVAAAPLEKLKNKTVEAAKGVSGLAGEACGAGARKTSGALASAGTKMIRVFKKNS